jgi:hypothetical protein
MKKIISHSLAAIMFLGIVSCDAQKNYVNYSENKPVTTSWGASNAHLASDGDLETGSVRRNPRGSKIWIEIDLTAEFKLGGAHVHNDVRGRVPVSAFAFEYFDGESWLEVPGGCVENNRKGFVVLQFDEVVSATKIRITSSGNDALAVNEIQIWGKDVPGEAHGLSDTEKEKFIASEHWICVNQQAYNTGQPKRFTVPTAESDLPFEIRSVKSDELVYEGRLTNGLGDFSDFRPDSDPDEEYYISVEGDDLSGQSYSFRIGKKAIQEMAYGPNVAFFNDARSMVGTHPSAYGGTAWRDGTYYTYELPSLVMVYLSDPSAFDAMPVTLDWVEEKKLVFSPDYKTTNEPNDDDALPTIHKYYSELPAPDPNTPDIIQNIQFTTGWILLDPVSADPSGDTLREQLHSQTIEQLAYFLYGYPAYEKYIDKGLYDMVLDSAMLWWEQSGLYEVITKVGNWKGRHAPGHSVMPNLLMYEVAKREFPDKADAFMDAAVAQAEWLINTVDWNDPVYTKGQRISEHKLITGISYFLDRYPDRAPEGLLDLMIGWAESAVALSDNMWDFRRYDAEEFWTLPGYNEAGNVIAFMGVALSVAIILEEGELKDRLVELAFAHYDNFNGRNPQNAHCANHPELGFEGIEKGWPYGDSRRNICARLETVRGSLSSLPGSEMYPFNPKGRPRWGEGWTSYNALWNISLAYLNYYEGMGDPFPYQY